MAKKETYESRTAELLEPILSECRFELVDIDYEKEAGDWYLRIYIDKPGGITIDDCEKVSRALSDRLDEEDFMDEAYVLEVSSPGLTRPLKKEKDFERNIGKPVEMKFFRPVGGRKELTAELKAYDRDSITVCADGADLVIERKNLSMIRQAFVWETE